MRVFVLYRLVLVLITLGLTFTLSLASAHATLVLGRFSVTPARPAADALLTLSLRLEDPTQVPVEDAYIFAELRPESAPDAAPVRAEFSETDTAGVYEVTATLQNPGPYRVLLRDQTYRQEEAQAALTEPLRVGGPNTVLNNTVPNTVPNAAQDFVFPPTATGAAGLRTWLLWLIGLPVAAALLVTVLVLTRGDPQGKQGDKQGKNADEAAPKA